MDRQTYKIIKRAHRNATSESDFKKIKLSIPILKHRVKILKGEIERNLNISSLPKKFSKIDRNLAYKDELVITYLLFWGKILNHSLLTHIFATPQSQVIFNWMLLFKRIVYSIIVLLYNRKFTDQDWINLDEMVQSLSEGHCNSVRHYLNQMKLLTISNDVSIILEEKYHEIYALASDDFGPFYWQMLHFMAEAIDLRKNAEIAKNLWKEFTILLLDRTLLCSICKTHYKDSIVSKYKKELQNATDYASLWFIIHNDVNNSLEKLEYPRSEFEKDQLIIRDLLSPKK